MKCSSKFEALYGYPQFPQLYFFNYLFYLFLLFNFFATFCTNSLAYINKNNRDINEWITITFGAEEQSHVGEDKRRLKLMVRVKLFSEGEWRSTGFGHFMLVTFINYLSPVSIKSINYLVSKILHCITDTCNSTVDLINKIKNRLTSQLF